METINESLVNLYLEGIKQKYGNKYRKALEAMTESLTMTEDVISTMTDEELAAYDIEWNAVEDEVDEIDEEYIYSLLEANEDLILGNLD